MRPYTSLQKMLPALLRLSLKSWWQLHRREVKKLWHILMRYDRQMDVKVDNTILKKSAKFLFMYLEKAWYILKELV